MKDSGFLWHTVDTSSNRGRAVDYELTNPLTGKPMTGSSSATALNVLNGVNDIGIGTDGGGSVIYPSMALNLYGVLLAGIGFQGEQKTGLSTEGIAFTPGIGLISFLPSILDKALEALIGETPPETCSSNILYSTEASQKGSASEYPVPDTDDRNKLIDFLNKVFLQCPIYVHYEKYIDMYGLGDSILGTLGMEAFQKASGKRLGKIANMVEASVFIIPDRNVSSGFLILAKKGKENFLQAWALARSFQERRPQAFLDYFGKKLRSSKDELLFYL